MNKIAASLFAGLPIGALACGGPAAAVGHEGADATAMMFVAGDGGVCDGSPQGVLGMKVTLDARWPETVMFARGSGTMSLWLLLRYAVDGSGAIAGTVQTCGMQIPAFLEQGYCITAVCPPVTETPRLQLTIPAGSWDGTPTTRITGAQGGSSMGSTFSIDPVVTLFGLKHTSALVSASQAWPVSATDLAASDLTYADGGAYRAGVGEPGILTIPLGTPPDVLPTTSLAPSAPQVDELWLVLRTQFSLHGTDLSCAEQTGTVEVNTLESHVVGCHLVDGGPCTMDQDVFVDENRPGFGQPANGSFQAKPMVAAGCKDVLEKLP